MDKYTTYLKKLFKAIVLVYHVFKGECMKVKIELENDLVEDEVIIRCSDLNENIKKLQETILKSASNYEKIIFFKDGKEYYLQLNAILFFETNGNDVDAHTPNDTFRVKYRLYELEESLPNNFVRISKSTILNINHIYSIDKNLTSSSIVQFYNTHKKVYVSRYYYKGLRKNLERKG